MNRTIVFSAALAGTLLAAGGLQAQSDTDGFMLGVHLVGAGLEPSGAGSDMHRGGGLGLQLGYGFNDRIGVYLNLDGGSYEVDDRGTEFSYSLATADLGVRVNFGNPSMRLRPWLNAALTGQARAHEAVGNGETVEQTYSGGGLTAGGGVQYFFSRSLALDAGVLATAAAYTEVEEDDESSELTVGLPFAQSRLQLGVTWHP